VLEAQGHSLLSPSDRAGLHPLIIPLSTFEESAAGKHMQLQQPWCLKQSGSSNSSIKSSRTCRDKQCDSEQLSSECRQAHWHVRPSSSSSSSGRGEALDNAVCVLPLLLAQT
jgi:hypothetical protein